jgi:hypothetical protein
MILIPQLDFGITMLVNGQTSDDIHGIAGDIANLALGKEIELPAAPWWASWAAVDRLATGALGLSFVFLIVLVILPFRKLRTRYKAQESITNDPVTKSFLRIWKIVLPSAPLALISISIAVIFGFVQVYLGFNIFKVISRFGGYAPPGVMISAITVLVVIFLLALALAGTNIPRLIFRSRAQDK